MVRLLRLYRDLNRSGQIHATLFVVWVILAFPSVLMKGWRESIPYLVFISVYAVIVSHWGALEAALAKRAVAEMSDSPPEPL